ncbi:restriction endonuclease subunit S [Micromonospora sp. CPCC 205714]|uniref:restriction endonuclease subunit S n=1 Tax=Micromonospora sp. CPCC 205714 TaxID=3122402 RepID=UPI002FF12DF3
MTWRRTRLKYLAEVPIRNGLGEAGAYDDPSWPRYVRTTDIADARNLRSDVFKSLPPSVAAKASLRHGDLLLSAAGTIGKSYLHSGSSPACFAGYLVRFRPRSDIDPRFVAYWTESRPYWDQIQAGAVRSTIENFSAGKFQNLVLDVPPLDEQRRVADFLDAETSRMDRVRVARSRLQELLRLKRERVIEHLIGDQRNAHQLIPLKHLVDSVSVGIVITPAAWYVESDGVPALRGINVKPGRIDDKDLVQISHEGHLVHRKSRLKAGDLVVVRTGQAGAAAVVTPEFDGANCIDLVIVRPGPFLAPRFAEYLLNSSYAKRRVAEFAVGSIQSHFNVAAMKAMPVPRKSPADQKRIVSEIDRAIEPIEKSVVEMQKQDELLVERRQAIITAAVTGQIDVTTARGMDV